MTLLPVVEPDHSGYRRMRRQQRPSPRFDLSVRPNTAPNLEHHRTSVLRNSIGTIESGQPVYRYEELPDQSPGIVVDFTSLRRTGELEVRAPEYAVD